MKGFGHLGHLGHLGRLVSASAIVLLSAACGSNVDLGSVNANSAPSDGLSIDATGNLVGNDPSSAPSTQTGSAADGSSASAQPDPSAASDDATVAPGSGSTPSSVPAGDLSKPVLIGYSTADEANSNSTSSGVSGFSTGDQTAQVRAMTKYINDHGGILGRKITLVGYNFNTTQYASNPDGLSQAACDFWTQDNHVFAVLNTTGGGTPVLLKCLAQRKVPLIQARLVSWVGRTRRSSQRPTVRSPPTR